MRLVKGTQVPLSIQIMIKVKMHCTEDQGLPVGPSLGNVKQCNSSLVESHEPNLGMIGNVVMDKQQSGILYPPLLTSLLIHSWITPSTDLSLVGVALTVSKLDRRPELYSARWKFSSCKNLT